MKLSALSYKIDLRNCSVLKSLHGMFHPLRRWYINPRFVKVDLHCLEQFEIIDILLLYQTSIPMHTQC